MHSVQLEYAALSEKILPITVIQTKLHNVHFERDTHSVKMTKIMSKFGG